MAVAGERGRSDVERLMAEGADEEATEGQGDALRSFEWAALLVERRDDGRELTGGGGGVRDGVGFILVAGGEVEGSSGNP